MIIQYEGLCHKKVTTVFKGTVKQNNKAYKTTLVFVPLSKSVFNGNNELKQRDILFLGKNLIGTSTKDSIIKMFRIRNEKCSSGNKQYFLLNSFFFLW